MVPLDTRSAHLFSLNGVSFNYKRRRSNGAIAPDGEAAANATVHFGFIAQEVERKFPELVGVSEATGMQSVQYAAFVPLLVEGMKTLRSEGSSLSKRVDEMRRVITVKGLAATGAVTAHHTLVQRVPGHGSTEKVKMTGEASSDESEIKVRLGELEDKLKRKDEELEQLRRNDKEDLDEKLRRKDEEFGTMIAEIREEMRRKFEEMREEFNEELRNQSVFF